MKINTNEKIQQLRLQMGGAAIIAAVSLISTGVIILGLAQMA